MKMQRLLGALCAGLMLISAPSPAAEQSSYVMPVAGPMSMATFAGTHLNPALRALATCHNGSSAPANGTSGVPLAYQCWIDTTANPSLYKIYDGADWITLGSINTSTNVWSPYGSGTNLTGVPISTGISGLGAGIATALAVNVGSAGAPVVFNGALGTPSSGTATNLSGTASGLTAGNVTTNANLTGDVTSTGNATTLATVNSNVGSFGSATAAGTFTVNGKGLITAAGSATVTPAIGSVTGLGTGIATALGVNAGAAGAPVLFDGALGTPSSGTATNLTGTASGLTAGNVTTNANLTGDVTSVGNATTLTNAPVIAKVLTGFTSGAGTVSAADSILAALQKLDGNDALKAPLASPALTGTPTAPTATPSDNSTKIATTAYVDAQVAGGVSGVASLNGQTGALTAYFPPQGRLTLQTGVPVMTTTQSAKTTIYYTPYVGNMLPLYDGSNMVPTAFSELSIATTDTTKNPAAIGASKVNDWFVWSDGGTIRLSHGPDWTNDTARSAGTALVMVNGIYLNNADITNGPAASRGTYVGTTRSNGSSQIDWIYGGSAAGGQAGFFGVWNTYNRIQVASITQDSAASYTHAVSTTIRAANGSATMRATFVRGLDEDGVQATFYNVGTPGASTNITLGIGLDSTSTYSPAGSLGFIHSSASAMLLQVAGKYSGLPGLGVHYLSANENQNSATSSTWYPNAATTGATLQQGLHVLLRQ